MRAAAIGVESRTALAPARPSLGLVVDDSNKCSVSWKTENGIVYTISFERLEASP